MKVLLINGSRRDAGCTYTALSKAAEAIESEGVETEIINVGSRVLKGEVDEVVKEAGEKVNSRWCYSRFAGILRISQWRNHDVS